jgi:hypothetical protein
MVGLDQAKRLSDWEGEGGAISRPKHRPATWARPRDRRPEDTSEGCDAMAAADMDRAARQTEGWAKIRFEHSAVMWSRRAKWLLAAETPARRG